MPIEKLFAVERHFWFIMPLVSALYSHWTDFGISGLVIASQLFYILRLDRRLEESNRLYRAECEARVQDAKAYTELALELHQRVISSLGHLGDLLGSEPNGSSSYQD